MTRTGKFGAVAGTLIFPGASYLIHTNLYGGAVAQSENFWCQFPYATLRKKHPHSPYYYEPAVLRPSTRLTDKDKF